ncbi:hypothetical protein SH668x_003138 [Planctomicrobium sp. SH668]|uniref:hypothetical protein n=1 Tax=Planctomicrobium sp. SH668 TaxID=3448126 RepID=UPI003F5C68B1
MNNRLGLSDGRRWAVPVLCFSLFALGCGGGGDSIEGVKVTGKVTYKGVAVEEGSVNFYSPEKSVGGTAPINPDGTYETLRPLPAATYQVSISPAKIEKAMAKATPALVPKDMPNIPQKYRSGTTSGFSAEVTGESKSIDFEMK